MISEPFGGRLRVLLFSHETTLSGAPMQLLHLARYLHEQECDVLFAAPEPGPISEELAKNGIALEFDDAFLVDPRQSALETLARRFDVVVANTIAGWPMVRAARRAGVPVVWYLHETLVGVRLIGQIAEIRPSLEQADLIITPTRETARVYEGITRTPIQVVPYGIPDLGFDAKEEDGAAVRFLILGSYEPRKGQDICLDAIRLLDPELRNRAQFRFAGRPLDAAFFERLQQSAAALPNVELLTGVDHTVAERASARN